MVKSPHFVKHFLPTRHVETDVLVQGAGITGLMLSKKLAENGLQVTLVDKAPVLGTGASTKNEGWLHRGTYHSNSIADRARALRVASRCIYGHDQIRHYAPEACEDIHLPSFAVTFDTDRTKEIESRWNEAGVHYRSVTIAELRTFAPQVKTADLAAAYKVIDIGINTRILYRKLLGHCERLGVAVFPSTSLHIDNETDIYLTGEKSDLVKVTPRKVVFTTGYGTKQLLEDELKINIPMRFFKSHLIIIPRLSDCSVFCLDIHQAAMMNHNDVSIVGLNEDAFETDIADFEIVEEKVHDLRQAIDRLFVVSSSAPYHATACVKVDVEKAGSARSLDVVILPVGKERRYLCALPGKMTEAPYVTDIVTRQICEELLDNRIAFRPCDMWNRDNLENNNAIIAPTNK